MPASRTFVRVAPAEVTTPIVTGSPSRACSCVATGSGSHTPAPASATDGLPGAGTSDPPRSCCPNSRAPTRVPPADTYGLNRVAGGSSSRPTDAALSDGGVSPGMRPSWDRIARWRG